MSMTRRQTRPRWKYHPHAYVFVSEALKFTQESLGRETGGDPDDEASHISGRELLEGIRQLALKHFGPMAPSVFHHWGVRTTDDFGRIVFELIEKGEMRKTERDQLSDFHALYDFEDVFCRDYEVDTSRAFKS